MIALLVGLSVATAAEHHLVRPGQTLESIAQLLGDPSLADEIAQMNGLAPGATLIPGTLLDVPDQQDAPGSPPAQLSSLKGNGVAYMPPDAQPNPLFPGQALPLGTLVCTDADSFARIRLAVQRGSFQHDEVSLLPSTCLRIERLTSRPNGRRSTLLLESGSIAVRETESDGELILRSEDGITTGSRGGFRVTREDGATRTEATQGPVAVLSGGQEVRLQIGEGSRLRKGLPPSPPTRLLPAGALRRPGKGEVLYRATFTWAPVPDALGYRIEIAADPDFTEMMIVEDVDRTEWEPDLLLLPTRVSGVWWRVSPFDRAGFQGLSDESRPIRYPVGIGTFTDPGSTAEAETPPQKEDVPPSP